ncbi:MAG TPA: HEAT repeat domain-containing protein [Fimbriiglobus sp.]|jgi:HEAT repeat protein
MRVRPSLFLLVGVLACTGCGNKEKSTAELLTDMKGKSEKDKLIAVRLLPQKGDPAQTVPALIEALKDPDTDIRISAAIGLGSLGDKAKDAIPALQTAARDRDARVREAVGKAIKRIDPSHPAKPSGKPGGG